MNPLNPSTVIRSSPPGDVPLRLRPLFYSQPLFIQRRFIPPLHPANRRSDRGEGVPFLWEKKVQNGKRGKKKGGDERGAPRLDMKPPLSLANNRRRPPRPQPLDSRAPSAGVFQRCEFFGAQVKISREPSATKHSITFK